MTTARRAVTAPVLGLFERWLIVVGRARASWPASRSATWAPRLFDALSPIEIAQVNLPVGVLIWVMIIPMLLRIDFGALHQVRAHWRGIGVTLFVNWAVKPFSMALLALALHAPRVRGRRCPPRSTTATSRA